jgi:hypothetical protein
MRRETAQRVDRFGDAPRHVERRCQTNRKQYTAKDECPDRFRHNRPDEFGAWHADRYRPAKSPATTESRLQRDTFTREVFADTLVLGLLQGHEAGGGRLPDQPLTIRKPRYRGAVGVEDCDQPRHRKTLVLKRLCKRIELRIDR